MATETLSELSLEQLMDRRDKQLAAVQNAQAELDEVHKAISEVAAQNLTGTKPASNGKAPAAEETTTPSPRRTRGGIRKKKATVQKRQPKTTVVKKKSSGTKVRKKTKGDGRKYGQKMSCREAIWNVLNRSPDEWSEYFDEFPEDAEGLTIAEIKHIIETDKLWESSSEDISPQLSSHLYGLKKDDKVVSEDHRYTIVEGAEL